MKNFRSGWRLASASLITSLLLLIGCGQKGALVYPQKPPLSPPQHASDQQQQDKNTETDQE